MGYLAPARTTNDIRVTTRRGAFRSTFTNGILAAQWLRNVLNEDGVIENNELIDKISNPNDPHRKYLAGDVIPLIREFFHRPGAFFLSLYELEDKELVEILEANADRIYVILSNTAAGDGGKWDARNQAARKRLVDAGVDIRHRMFNNTTHIGHNKFAVHVPPGGASRSVFTGVFLAFYPGQSGKDCIIGEAIDIGIKDPTLLVAGAVSATGLWRRGESSLLGHIAGVFVHPPLDFLSTDFLSTNSRFTSFGFLINE